MTKTKLAKLKAQAQNNIFSPQLKPVNEGLATAANGRQIPIDNFVALNPGVDMMLHPSADVPGAFEFIANRDNADILHDQLDYYNWEVHGNSAPSNEPPVSFAIPSGATWSPTDEFTITFPALMHNTPAATTHPAPLANTNTEVNWSDEETFKALINFNGDSA